MKKTTFLISIAMLMLFSCAKKNTGSTHEQLEISHTTICGWCAPGDSLTITKASTSYLYYPSSCERKGDVKQDATDDNDWNELVSLLNIEKFKKINLSLCNVCADGCDAIVTVKSGNFTHTISYGGIDNEAVASIKPFLEKLIAIQKKYRPLNASADIE